MLIWSDRVVRLDMGRPFAPLPLSLRSCPAAERRTSHNKEGGAKELAVTVNIFGRAEVRGDGRCLVANVVQRRAR